MVVERPRLRTRRVLGLVVKIERERQWKKEKKGRRERDSRTSGTTPGRLSVRVSTQISETRGMSHRTLGTRSSNVTSSINDFSRGGDGDPRTEGRSSSVGPKSLHIPRRRDDPNGVTRVRSLGKYGNKKKNWFFQKEYFI